LKLAQESTIYHKTEVLATGKPFGNKRRKDLFCPK